MKTIYIMTTVILVMVITVSCDRFDNTFEPVEEDTLYQERLEDFASYLTDSLNNEDIEDVMSFYAEDYLYDGKTKDDVEAFFTGLAASYPDSFHVEIKSVNYHALSFTYQISVWPSTYTSHAHDPSFNSKTNRGIDDNSHSLLESITQNNEAVFDTTIVEYTSGRDEDYLIIGNQQEAAVSPDRKILVELFTALWCPNCPYVEAALHSLKQQHRDKFYYIEYHRMDKFDFGNEEIASYYDVASLPVGIIQGQTRITGGSEAESFAEYEHAISSYFDQEAEFFFNDFDYSVNGESISFSLQVSTDRDIDDNLYLKYALLEKESETTNAAGEPVRNIVIAQDQAELVEEMFSIDDENNEGKAASIDKNIAIPDFAFNKPALIFWVQTKDVPYDPQTSIVHNTQEYELTW